MPFILCHCLHIWFCLCDHEEFCTFFFVFPCRWKTNMRLVILNLRSLFQTLSVFQLALQLQEPRYLSGLSILWLWLLVFFIADLKGFLCCGKMQGLNVTISIRMCGWDGHKLVSWSFCWVEDCVPLSCFYGIFYTKYACFSCNFF